MNKSKLLNVINKDKYIKILTICLKTVLFGLILDNFQGFPNFYKSGYCFVQMFFGVGR